MNREDNNHYINEKFHNEVEWKQPGIIESFRTIGDFIFFSNNRRPKYELPHKEVDISFFNRSGGNRLTSTWLGHSSLMINIDGYKILTDPVFEKSITKIFGPRRFNGKIPLDIYKIKNVDVVLISHNHYDHLNKFSIIFLKNRAKQFIVPIGVKKQLVKWGIPNNKIIELNWWESCNFDKYLKITATPTQHFSGRGIFDRNKTLWESFVIESQNHKIYFSGDSGYFNGFKLIGNKYGPFNIAFVETGAYNKAWHDIHMFPEESVQASIDLKTEYYHPIHCGTFNLSLHSWDAPMKRAKQSAHIKGVKIVLPVVGETIIYNNFLPNEEWWNEKEIMEKI